MPNVTSDVARMGWELYSGSDPRPSRDDINADLSHQGYGPISERTFRHYRKLERHGYVDYIPINELDVRIKMTRLRRAS